jgi:L-lactate dehydrogenase
MKKHNSKITIVGSGLVGSTIAYTLMLAGTVSEIVLIDANDERAVGEAMDLGHAASFVKPVIIRHGDFTDAQDSSVVVFTAGAKRKEGQNRLELQSQNIDILRQSLPQVMEYAKDAIVIIVANPVDILTYAAWKITGLPAERILGSGTVLDSSRFRYALAKEYQVDARNIHAQIIGEHGDTEVPIWSLANISGVGLEEFHHSRSQEDFTKLKERIFDSVKQAGAETIKRKGATYYAVAASVKRIIESIVRNEHSVLTVSSYIDEMYGFGDVALSLPTVVAIEGRKSFLELPLVKAEIEQLQFSAETLSKNIKQLGLTTKG